MNPTLWKTFETTALGHAQYYVVLTRPSFAYGAKIQLGADGFWAEAKNFLRETFTKATKGHSHIIAWREPDGATNRQHIHAIVRCENKPALSNRQLEDAWFFWWVKDKELAPCLSNINIQAKVETYDPLRSRAYLLDHHELWMETFCSHARPCRRGCWFEKSPRSIQGWTYRDRKPLQNRENISTQ
jgi:hypothetical protein